MGKTIDAGPLLEKLNSTLKELQAKSEEHKDYAMCRGFMLAMKEVENAVVSEKGEPHK